jgi:hypothetical protein
MCRGAKSRFSDWHIRKLSWQAALDYESSIGLVFTTLPDTNASVERVLETYRLRWQVALTFKASKPPTNVCLAVSTSGPDNSAQLYETPASLLASIWALKKVDTDASSKPLDSPAL